MSRKVGPTNDEGGDGDEGELATWTRHTESQKQLSLVEKKLKLREQAEIYRAKLKKIPWWSQVLNFNRTPLRYHDQWIGW